MRQLPLLIILSCAACTAEPDARQRALAEVIESKVKLPPGAGGLQCYARHYALVQGEELGLPKMELVQGHFVRMGKPGVY
jgi:hypothetical protein